jgi:hypothetical protein
MKDTEKVIPFQDDEEFRRRISEVEEEYVELRKQADEVMAEYKKLSDKANGKLGWLLKVQHEEREEKYRRHFEKGMKEKYGENWREKFEASKSKTEPLKRRAW